MACAEVKLDPSNGTSLFVSRFDNVKNMPELKAKLSSGELKCGLLRSRFVVDLFQLSSAAYLALESAKTVMANVHLETIFNLSPTKSISATMKTIPAQEGDTGLALFVVGSRDGYEAAVGQVDGDLCEDVISPDVEEVKRLYQITDKELSVSPLLDLVVTRIACKNFSIND